MRAMTGRVQLQKKKKKKKGNKTKTGLVVPQGVWRQEELIGGKAPVVK
jgi:hypothetical protein